MFIGHFAVGYGAKIISPKTSLGTLFLAAQFIDLLWPTLLLLGVESVAIVPGITKFTPLDFISYPISHSLLMVSVWAGLFGGIYWLLMKNMRGAIILGVCVISHWFLDLIVHRPDLPISLGDSPLYGLGLWNSIPATIVLEGLIFIVGIILFLRVSKSTNRVQTINFWALVGFLVIMYVGNVFGPPPPDVESVAWVSQLQWLLVIWAYWVDKKRKVIPR